MADAQALDISTHTPVKGVTDIEHISRQKRRISTHTPVKGVTEFKVCYILHTLFQPTHP